MSSEMYEAAAGARRRLRWPSPAAAPAAAVLVLVAGWAAVPGWFASHSPTAADPGHSLAAPSTGHPFGTDNLGRDVFSRVVHGTAASVGAASLAVGVALAVGSLLGVLAGFLGGWADHVISRLVDVLLSIPALLLAMTLVTVLGFGTPQVALAVGLVSVATVTRVMRSEVLRVSGSDYVTAATLSGRGRGGVLWLHVLPNSLRPVLALAALEFAGAVLAISSLSFLGFGAQPPSPEWGALIASGRGYIATAWWLTLLPGAIVAIVVWAANVLSRAVDDRSRIR